MLKAASPSVIILEGGLPVGQGGGIGVGVGEGLGEVGNALGHIGTSPIGGGRGGPQAVPLISTDRADHDVLEQVDSSPGGAEGQADLAGGFDLVASGEEVIQGLEIGLGVGGDTSGSQNFRVVPQHVRAVNVHRDAVGMTILRDQGEQGRGQNFVKAGRCEEIIQGFDLTGSHIGGDGFLTGMGLPGIGRIIGSQTGGQNGFGVRASAAGYGCIDEFDARDIAG